MNKKILLVGGAGYIGTVLTNNFLSKNYKIKCFDSLIYSQKHCIQTLIKEKNYEFILGDLRNYNSFDNLFKGITDVVILAGLVGDPITKKYPLESKEINYNSLKNFIVKCNKKNINKVIFISTCSNYGLIEKNEKADENYTLNPLSSYAKHKVELEKYIMSLEGQVDYNPTILRFATAFGVSPRMRFDLTINEFTRDLYLKKNLEIYDANTWRPYCHVNDFSQIIDKIFNSKKEKTSFQIFNAGGDKNNSTKLEIIKKLEKYFPKSKITFKDKGVDPRNYRVDFSKIKDALNFEPTYTIEDGIKEIINNLEKGKYNNPNEFSDSYGNYKINNEIIV